MNEIYYSNPEELEAEVDSSLEEDEILTLDENGKPVVVDVEDDPEDPEEPVDVEYN